MKRQRLMELAGIASNMSNPSNEPGTGIPDNPPAHAIDGEDDMPSGDDEQIEGTDAEVRELAMQGLNAESVEEAQDYFQRILKLMGEELEPSSDESDPEYGGNGSEEGGISFKRFNDQ